MPTLTRFFPSFGDAVEVLGDLGQVSFHDFDLVSVLVEHLIGKTVDPFLDLLLRLSFVHLVGFRLVLQAHEHVAVDDCRDRPSNHRKGNLQSRVGLQAGKVQGDDGNVIHSGSLQAFPQEHDVVGGTAAAACLGDHEGDLVKIVFAREEGVDHLAATEDGGIAHVVLDEFQSRLGDFRRGVGQKLCFVAVVGKDSLEDGEVDGGHHREKDGVILFHVRGEDDASGLLVPLQFFLFHRLSASLLLKASSKERMRILTAPRFVISSILTWV